MVVNAFTDVPQGSHTLAADQPPMESNFLYLVQTLGVNQPNKSPPNTLGDHQIFLGSNDGNLFEGRHLRVSLNNQGSTALTCVDGADNTIWSSNGSIYCRNTTESGPVQLTQNFSPVASLNGYTFLPGGLLLQWGSVNSIVSGTQNFPIPFPNVCFNIQMTPYTTTSDPMTQLLLGCTLNGAPINNTTFKYFFVYGATHLTGFFWMAIGN